MPNAIGWEYDKRMKMLLGLAVVVVIASVLVRFLHRIGKFIRGLQRGVAGKLRDRRLPFCSRTYLLSKNEAAFFHSLSRVVGNQYVISMKVRLADVLKCSREGWREGYGNKISQKHLDFVLCDPRTIRIIAAIELDDASHQRRDRIDRDAFLDAAMKAAAVPLIRVPAAMQYSVDKLAAKLNSVLTPASRVQ